MTASLQLTALTPINHNNNSHESSPALTISYKENLSEVELLSRIREIPNAQIIFWYIGAYGLKEDGVNFYKDKIGEILNYSNDASCWLLDFTAWGAFQNPKAKISSTHRCVDQINQFNLAKLKCISAATLFNEMQNIREEGLLTYFRNHVVSRASVGEASQQFKESGIKIGQIFDQNCPIFEQIYDTDCSKSYSIVQYVEGCFIINEIIKNIFDKQDTINLVFALPNDEAKYYQDSENNFIKDLEVFLKYNFGDRLNHKSIHVHFLNFRYGNEIYHRPYNSGKKVLKNITKDMVL